MDRGGRKTKRVVSASTNDLVSDNRLLEILDCTVRQFHCLPHYIYAQIIFEATLGLLHAALPFLHGKCEGPIKNPDFSWM